jgi:hypothetical protein
MLQPLTHTWTNPRTRPLGLGFNSHVYRAGQAIHRPRTNPLGTGLHGLGLGATIEQESAVIGSAVSSATLAIPGVGPLVAAAVQAATAVAVAIETLFSGCGATCTQATTIANQVAGLLQQNLSGYMSLPQPHYASVQAYYLSIFDQTWAQLLQACNNPQLAAAGQRCITDRQQGACTWQTSPSGWSQASDGTWSYTGAGPSGSGTTCWNWFVGYRDPIANDPTVIPDPVAAINPDGSTTTSTINPQTGSVTTSTTPPSTTSQLSTALNSLTSSIPAPLLLGGVALVLLMILGGD